MNHSDMKHCSYCIMSPLQDDQRINKMFDFFLQNYIIFFAHLLVNMEEKNQALNSHYLKRIIGGLRALSPNENNALLCNKI